ncbi:MAG: transglutaminase family protein, partial [Alphaproteobacteria bacterium]|nr:transglutaminase family protein [Alphaproteobacteria bacterium]
MTHSTVYRYDRPVHLGPQVVRLRPAPHCRTPIISYSLRVKPSGHFINWQEDPFGNFLDRVVLPEMASEFTVDVDLVADMAVINPFDFFLKPDAETCPFAYEPDLLKELTPYRDAEPTGPALARWLDAVPRDAKRTIDFLVDLNQRLQRDIAYIIRLESGVQTSEETLERATGSCRDSAWLMVQILRHLGLAARFVSVYLIQLKPDVLALDGPSGTPQD